MSKEIKYRVWNGVRFNYGHVNRQGSQLYWDEHYDPQLYTGLKDKNGVEVYENDIVRGPSNTAVILETSAKSNRQKIVVFEVRWSEHQFWGGWVLKPLGKTNRTYPAFSNSEVIGNIYENPELLEGK